MQRVAPLELEVMSNVYRFLNGGGTLNLFDALIHQLSTLLNSDDEMRDAGEEFLQSVSSDKSFETLKKQTSDHGT